MMPAPNLFGKSSDLTGKSDQKGHRLTRERILSLGRMGVRMKDVASSELRVGRLCEHFVLTQDALIVLRKPNNCIEAPLCRLRARPLEKEIMLIVLILYQNHALFLLQQRDNNQI